MKLSAIAAFLVSTIAFGATPINGADSRAEIRGVNSSSEPWDKQKGCDPSDALEILAKIQSVIRIVDSNFLCGKCGFIPLEGDTLDLAKLGAFFVAATGELGASALMGAFTENDDNGDGKLDRMEVIAAVGMLLKDKCAEDVNGYIRDFNLVGKPY